MPLRFSVGAGRANQWRSVRLDVLAAVVQRLLPQRAAAIVSLQLVVDREIRRLNRQWRGVDQVTDVLSFPLAEPIRQWPRGRRRTPPLGKGGGGDSLPPLMLGEVVISLPQARRQARWLRIGLGLELRYLVIHGLLHLAGLDHAALGTARRFAVAERITRQAVSLPKPG